MNTKASKVVIGGKLMHVKFNDVKALNEFHMALVDQIPSGRNIIGIESWDLASQNIGCPIVVRVKPLLNDNVDCLFIPRVLDKHLPEGWREVDMVEIDGTV